jgi:hypothetical protein
VGKEERKLGSTLCETVGMTRKLVFVKSDSFVGWRCDTCGWVAPLPRFADQNPIGGIVASFTRHNCEENPRERERQNQGGG